MSVITAVTAQNTQGVFAVLDITPEMIEQQIAAIFDDIPVDALKIGMVSQTATIAAIAKTLTSYAAKNVVVDPVMISKSGYDLLQPEAKQALIETLLPLADLVTPNIPEAEVIIGRKIATLAEMEQAHPRHRLHLIGGHHCQPGRRAIHRGIGDACQTLHHHGY